MRLFGLPKKWRKSGKDQPEIGHPELELWPIRIEPPEIKTPEIRLWQKRK